MRIQRTRSSFSAPEGPMWFHDTEVDRRAARDENRNAGARAAAPPTRSATSWRRALAGAFAILASGVLAASCGGDDNDDGGSTTTPFGACSLGGTLCQLRCSDGFGCVECLDNTQCSG